MQEHLGFEQGMREVALGHFERADIAKDLQRHPANREGHQHAGIDRVSKKPDGEQEQHRRRARPKLLRGFEVWEVFSGH